MLFSLPKPPRLFFRHPSSSSSSCSAVAAASPPLSAYSSSSKWPDLVLSIPISALCHLHQLLARAVISGLLRGRHLHRWNSLLHSLACGGTPELALSLYNLIRSGGVAIDDYSLTASLKAAAALSLPEKGMQIHSTSLKLGLGFDTFVLNSLIHMYAACGLVGDARKVFDSAPDCVRDVVSWNSMISGYLQNGLCEEALSVFGKIVESSIRMDVVTPVSALIACGRIGAVDLGRRIHALIVVNGFDLNVYLGSSLVSMYAKCGAIEDARKLFDIIPNRNVICWTSMISGYTQSGQFKECIDLFRKMQMAGVKADAAAIASVVSSCAQLGALDQARYIHKYCNINNVETSLSVKNALIDMYSKCGEVEKALQLFHGLLERDVISWTVMISGLAMNGYSTEALGLFSEMEALAEVVPNEVTFLGVLSACSHGGFVEKGQHYFKCMTNVYELKPTIEHYGCIVDLLGRAKLTEEAYEFIKEMPIEPDVVIWRSLLFACRAKGDVKLAEYAAERTLAFEPSNCGGHVLLSNVYAAVSRWNDVKRVRGAMSDWSINKQPGCSFIEIEGIVHEFFAADNSHEQADVINWVLWMFYQHLSLESYTLPWDSVYLSVLEA